MLCRSSVLFWASIKILVWHSQCVTHELEAHSESSQLHKNTTDWLLQQYGVLSVLCKT